MGDPRVIERDNPLTRALNRVNEVNEQIGTRAGGGGLAPPTYAPPPPAGGQAQVLPPRPVTLGPAEQPLGQQEVDALEAAWAADPTNPANRFRQPPPPQNPAVRYQPGYYPAYYPHPPVQQYQSPGPPQSVMPQVGTPVAIDLIAGLIRLDNGESIPSHPETLKQIRQYAYQAALQAYVTKANENLAQMKRLLGLEEEEEAKQTDGKQGVQDVPGRKGRKRVRTAQADEGRTGEPVPPVRPPVPAKPRRKAKRTGQQPGGEGGEA